MLSDIATMITTLGFPVVACIFLGWFIRDLIEANRQEIQSMQRDHQEEVRKMTEAIANNTLAITRLCERLNNE